MSAKPANFRKILVATDFSEHAGAALGRAVTLAERCGATLHVLHVVDHVIASIPGTSFAGHWRIPPAEIRRAEKRLCRESEEQLAGWIDPFRKTGVTLRTETVVGTAFVEIIRAVLRHKHELVLAGTRGVGGLHRLLVGSTAERLVRKCPCPVWIIHPEHEWPLRRILVPVDLTEVSGKCLNLAATLAKLWKCQLLALYVLNEPAAEASIEMIQGRGTSLARQRREYRQTAADHLHEFVAAHTPDGTDVEERLGVGHAWRMIGLTAKRIDASLIVMGSVARTGIPGFLIGNTAEKVLRTCDRSLLTVKPGGFVSPVTLID
jgi:nucleotide-binding universal stress UspA family protein